MNIHMVLKQIVDESEKLAKDYKELEKEAEDTSLRFEEVLYFNELRGQISAFSKVQNWIKQELELARENSSSSCLVKKDNALYGYEMKNGRLIVNRVESTIVNLIYELRSAGKNYTFIKNYLKELCVVTKHGKEFSTQAIRKMLSNPAYAGIVEGVDNGIELNITDKNGLHEPIIKQEIWYKVQAINEQSKTKLSSVKTKQLLLF